MCGGTGVKFLGHRTLSLRLASKLKMLNNMREIELAKTLRGLERTEKLEKRRQRGSFRKVIGHKKRGHCG